MRAQSFAPALRPLLGIEDSELIADQRSIIINLFSPSKNVRTK